MEIFKYSNLKLLKINKNLFLQLKQLKVAPPVDEKKLFKMLFIFNDNFKSICFNILIFINKIDNFFLLFISMKKTLK